MKALRGALLYAVVLALGCASSPPPRAPAAASTPVDARAARAARALEDAVLSCAKVASCTDPSDDPRFREPGACVEAWLARGAPGEADPLKSCLVSAASCDAARACLRGGGDAKAAAICAAQKGVVTTCDGDRFVRCADAERPLGSVVDCKELGGTCRESKASGGLIQRGCVAPQRCPEGAPESRCENDAVVRCHDGITERIPCSAGTRCTTRVDERGEPRAVCALSERASRCGLAGTSRCEGTRRVACDESGEAKVTDCEAHGLSCAATGLRAACIPEDAAGCDPSAPASCEDGGRILAFCAAGLRRRVACSEVGLGPCSPHVHGAAAACSSP